MSELEKLTREYEEKVRALQESCPHKHLSRWQPLFWALGHPTRFEVRICKRCGKIVKRRTHCDTCGKPVLVEKAIEGDGKTVPLGTYFCSKKCLKRYAENLK
ncbi:MAG TPA: hypothetical protein ENG66_05975 [Thermococcus sp.]|nr:hypothetical protein [Thermococcus sp.]